MPTSLQTADGVLPHGSFEVTILEDVSQIPFVVDSFNTDDNSKKLQSMSARGRVRRQKVIPTDETFSADFQLADESTQAPLRRSTFAVDADKDGNIEPYQIEKVGRVFQSDGEFKCKVNGFAMVNPLPYRTGSDSGDITSNANATGISISFGVYLPRDCTQTANSFSASGLPTGLTMSSVGLISGTPTTPGVYSPLIKVIATRRVEGVTETMVGVRKITWTIV